MKFQNHGIHGSKYMSDLKNIPTDKQTNRQMEGQAQSNMPYNFFETGA